MLRRSKTKIQVGIGHVCMISQIVAFLHSLWLDSCGGSIQFIGVQACQQKMDIGKLYICWPVRPVWACKCARCFFWTMTMLLDLHFTPKFQPPMVTTATHPTTKKQTHYYFPLQELRILDRKITKLINGLRISSSNDCWFASLVRIVVRVDAKLSKCTVQYSYWIQLRLAKTKSISCIYLPIGSFARVCL